MSEKSRLKKGRDDWKKKARTRGDQLRNQRKDNTRLKKERDMYKRKLKEAEAKLRQRSGEDKAVAVHAKADVVFIALLLFQEARIGFRAVSRVMEVLKGFLGLSKAPCTQTIINWVQRLSIARIDHACQLIGERAKAGADVIPQGSVWMLDTSIAIGEGKILCVLALNVVHHLSGTAAPRLSDVQCIGVSVASSWTGESIARFLQKLIEVMGPPLGFLKDGGTDLAKAVNQLHERGFAGQCIDDVSHMSANLLKHEYEDHPLFNTFIRACGRASSKLKQTILACLAPPKVSTKARFMNLHRLTLWASRVLDHCPAGRAAKGSLIARLRASIDELPGCRRFVERFLRDSTALLECQKILKTRGLSTQTAEQCRSVLEAIPPSSPVRRGFTDWLTRHLDIATRLGLAEIGLPVSTDPLESLFGVGKQHGTAQVRDASRITALLPSFCGPLTHADAQRVLEISVARQRQVMGALPSLTAQRRKILSNPGCLEDVLGGGSPQVFELIPRAGKRSKNGVNIEVSTDCRKEDGPAPPGENSGASLLEAGCA